MVGRYRIEEVCVNGSAKSRHAIYRAKRDFAKTSEPSGQKPGASSSTLRFVIQRHEATRLDRQVRRHRQGRERAPRLPARWRGRGAGQARRAGLR